MSSNAFARSRPRVRYQRVPKTQSYTHPRFLQLCKELARLDEVKKKQEESDDSAADDQVSCAKREPTITTSNDSSANTDPASSYLNDRPAHQSSSCASLMDNVGAHSSNGFRSLDRNQSILYDDQCCQNNYHSHIRCPRLYDQQQYHLQEPNQTSNITSNSYQQHQHNQHHPVRNSRCVAKCVPTSHQLNVSIPRNSLTKINLASANDVTQSNSNDLTTRQDENRSKRKRASSDHSSHGSRKLFSSNSPCSGKRQKSSPEPCRPLSPSFTKCPICLLDCMDRDPSFTNTCFHLFCYVCIENWSKSKATCPLCRTKFSKIIYNIRGAGNFEEKVASPIRRDDDDDRIIYEHLQSITSNPMVASHQAPPRNQHVDETQPRLYDNLRNNEVLMPPFAFINSQIDYRPLDSLHSFNTLSDSGNNTTLVPNPIQFNYNPYTTLIPTSNPSTRIHQPVTSTAISSAYAASSSINVSSSGNNNNPSTNNTSVLNTGILPRASRSNRYLFSRRNALPPLMDESGLRSTRSTNPNVSSAGTNITLERHQQHAVHYPSNIPRNPTVGIVSSINLQPRSSGPTLQFGALVNSADNNGGGMGRQGSHRLNIHPFPNGHIPYNITPPHLYPRRQYISPPTDQHQQLFNSLYGATQEPM